MEIANCKYCNSEYEMRRSDQKFCSNKCRSRFNNRNRLRNIPIIKETHKTLLNDYRIFLYILGNDQEVYLEKQKLRTPGFSGTQCTRLENLDNVKEPVMVIYDIAFYQYKENYFKIKKL